MKFCHVFLPLSVCFALYGKKKISGRRYILILCDTEWFHSKNAEITVGSFLKSSSASMDDHGLLTWVPHNTVKTVFRCTPEFPFLML